MKVRSDFVSNSSSCSFVIDAKHARKAYIAASKLEGLAVPYDIEEDITIWLYAKNKHVDMMFKSLQEHGIILEYQPPYHFDNEDPEDCCFDSSAITVEQFIVFAEKALSDIKLAELVDHITIESDDYGSGPMNLRDFYDFFKRNNCNPNAEDSEHEFTTDDSTDFRSALKGTR